MSFLYVLVMILFALVHILPRLFLSCSTTMYTSVSVRNGIDSSLFKSGPFMSASTFEQKWCSVASGHFESPRSACKTHNASGPGVLVEWLSLYRRIGS